MSDPYKTHINPGSMYTPLFTWRWPGRKMAGFQDLDREEKEPKLFDAVLQRSQQVYNVMRREVLKMGAGKHDNEKLCFPNQFKPTALRGILYPENGKLHAHQDMLMGKKILASQCMLILILSPQFATIFGFVLALVCLLI